jgi:hypothetical protein
VPFKSNFRAVAGAYSLLGDAFNPRSTPPGAARPIGEDLADLVAGVLHERTAVRRLGPAGAPLARLKPATIKRKLRKGYPPVVGTETGAMLAFAELRGEVAVTEAGISMQYGREEFLRARAEYFQEGRAGVQARRDFYALGADGERAVDGFVEDLGEAALRRFEGEGS